MNGVAPDLIAIFGDLLWRSVATIGGDEGVHTLENDTGPDDANHAQDGIFIAAGAGVEARGQTDLHLLDIAPTVLELLGLAIPEAMRGRSAVLGARRLVSERRMNLIVYVSDALRTDHLGCYGARFVRTPTIDEFARGGVRFDQAIAAAPWTRPSTASMITGLYPHRHGYLHWDAELDPAFPTLFTVAAAYGYETGSFVFDESYLFKGFADANVAGTSERLDGAVEWLAGAARPAVLPVVPQLGDAHALRRRSTATAASGGPRRTRSSPASSPTAPRRSRPCARATAARSSAPPRCCSPRSSSALDDLGLRERTASSSSPTTVSRGGSGSPTSAR